MIYYRKTLFGHGSKLTAVHLRLLAAIIYNQSLFELSFKFLYFSQSIRKINKRYKLTNHKQVMVLEAVLSAYVEKATIFNYKLLNE